MHLQALQAMPSPGTIQKQILSLQTLLQFRQQVTNARVEVDRHVPDLPDALSASESGSRSDSASPKNDSSSDSSNDDQFGAQRKAKKKKAKFNRNCYASRRKKLKAMAAGTARGGPPTSNVVAISVKSQQDHVVPRFCLEKAFSFAVPNNECECNVLGALQKIVAACEPALRTSKEIAKYDGQGKEFQSKYNLVRLQRCLLDHAFDVHGKCQVHMSCLRQQFEPHLSKGFLTHLHLLATKIAGKVPITRTKEQVLKQGLQDNVAVPPEQEGKTVAEYLEPLGYKDKVHLSCICHSPYMCYSSNMHAVS